MVLCQIVRGANTNYSSTNDCDLFVPTLLLLTSCLCGSTFGPIGDEGQALLDLVARHAGIPTPRARLAEPRSQTDEQRGEQYRSDSAGALNLSR